MSGTPTTAAGLDPLAAFRLDGKVAIVTGASSGLGARFARVLDAAGAKVVLLARRRERLEQLAGELREALPVGCDLTVTADIDRAMEAAIERFGRVDVLVNNAGAVDVAPALEEPLEQFQDVIAVNLVAPFALSQRAARAMLEHGDGGTIVNVASILGLVGVGQIPQAGYAASKGGIVNLTRELAAQVGPLGDPRQRDRPGLVRVGDDGAHVRGGERPQVGGPPGADGTPRARG